MPQRMVNRLCISDNLLSLHLTRHPLVSGFYKLLAVCMKICSKVSYFKVCLEIYIVFVVTV